MSSVPDDNVPEPPNTEALNFGAMTGYLGYQVRLANLMMQRRWAADLREAGLTQKQYTVLHLIQNNPGCSQVALGSALGTDRATMMALVSKLDQRGLVTRNRSKSDGRRHELYLSEAGVDLMARCSALVAEHERRHDELFRGREHSELMRMLQRIIVGP